MGPLLRLVNTCTRVTEEFTLFAIDGQRQRYRIGMLRLIFGDRRESIPTLVDVTGADSQNGTIHMTAEVLERMAAVLRDRRELAGDKRVVCHLHGYRPAEEVVNGALVCVSCLQEEGGLVESFDRAAGRGELTKPADLRTFVARIRVELGGIVDALDASGECRP